MDDIEERLSQVETNIIEQEHRFFPILKNFFERKKKWSESDPRRKASIKALIWRLFFSPAVVATAGGFLGIISLIFIGLEFGEIKKQNSLIQDQNKWFQMQIKSSEVTSLKGILLKSELKPLAMVETFKEYIKHQRELDAISGVEKRIVITSINLSGGSFIDEDNLFKNITFREVSFKGTSFENINFDGVVFDNCSFDTELIDKTNSGDNSNQYRFIPSTFINCNFENASFLNESRGFSSIFLNCNFNKGFRRLHRNDLSENKDLGCFYYSLFIKCMEDGEEYETHTQTEKRMNYNLFAKDFVGAHLALSKNVEVKYKPFRRVIDSSRKYEFSDSIPIIPRIFMREEGEFMLRLECESKLMEENGPHGFINCFQKLKDELIILETQRKVLERMRPNTKFGTKTVVFGLR